MQLCLVFEGSSHSAALLRIREAQKNEASTSLTLDFPVEMVSFHGPHFQDRYGLTQAASNSLESGNLPVLVMGCAGTSISLVVPQGCAKAAVRLLGKTFVVP
jgi:aspartokinase